MYISILVSLAGFLAIPTFAQTSFCITVQDVCCDDAATTGSHQLPEGANFSTYYVYYATGSGNKVDVTCYLDGALVWTRNGLCGCGTTSVSYPTSNEHLIEIKVKCSACTMPPCNSVTSLVKVYTPASHACQTECSGS